jgi:hypothetical protein
MSAGENDTSTHLYTGKSTFVRGVLGGVCKAAGRHFRVGAVAGKAPKRGIAGSMLVDRLRDHDRVRRQSFSDRAAA